ncbi:MAG: hypothetical protein Aurels2KO_16330 [Aureliella sp.]
MAFWLLSLYLVRARSFIRLRLRLLRATQQLARAKLLKVAARDAKKKRKPLAVAWKLKEHAARAIRPKELAARVKPKKVLAVPMKRKRELAVRLKVKLSPALVELAQARAVAR